MHRSYYFTFSIFFVIFLIVAEFPLYGNYLPPTGNNSYKNFSLSNVTTNFTNLYFNNTTTRITNATLDANPTNYDQIYIYNSTLIITNSLITGSINQNGNGLYIQAINSTIEVKNSKFINITQIFTYNSSILYAHDYLYNTFIWAKDGQISLNYNVLNKSTVYLTNNTPYIENNFFGNSSNFISMFYISSGNISHNIFYNSTNSMRISESAYVTISYNLFTSSDQAVSIFNSMINISYSGFCNDIQAIYAVNSQFSSPFSSFVAVLNIFNGSVNSYYVPSYVYLGGLPWNYVKTMIPFSFKKMLLNTDYSGFFQGISKYNNQTVLSNGAIVSSKISNETITMTSSIGQNFLITTSSLYNITINAYSPASIVSLSSNVTIFNVNSKNLYSVILKNVNAKIINSTFQTYKGVFSTNSIMAVYGDKFSSYQNGISLYESYMYANNTYIYANISSIFATNSTVYGNKIILKGLSGNVNLVYSTMYMSNTTFYDTHYNSTLRYSKMFILNSSLDSRNLTLYNSSVYVEYFLNVYVYKNKSLFGNVTFTIMNAIYVANISSKTGILKWIPITSEIILSDKIINTTVNVTIHPINGYAVTKPTYIGYIKNNTSIIFYVTQNAPVNPGSVSQSSSTDYIYLIVIIVVIVIAIALAIMYKYKNNKRR
ncbi:MAG: hypothetical protein ACP5RS_01925 [Thermoplasmata archaeon]